MRATALLCYLTEGSHTSFGLFTGFPRPFLHVRPNAIAHSEDRVTDFPRVVLRGRLSDHARAHG